MTDNNNFDGQQLKKRFREVGKTMRDLAEKTGIPYNTLNHTINGYQNGSSENLAKIEKVVTDWEEDFVLSGLKNMGFL